MNDKSLKRLAQKSFVLLAFMISISGVFTYQNIKLSKAKNKQTVEVVNIIANQEEIFNKESNNILESSFDSNQSDGYKGLLQNIQEVDKTNIKEPYLIIDKKGLADDTILFLEDLYMERSFKLTFTNANAFQFYPNVIANDSTSQSEIIKDVSFVKNHDNSGGYNVTLKVLLDNIYVHTLYQDDDHLYLILQKPSDVYDKIVVIDPGHGGNDIGTYSSNMDYYEKDLNLSIVLKLKELLDKDNIKAYYTRLHDDKLYLKQRVNLANDLQADLFISIHCNSSESEQANGIEVLYNEYGKNDPIDSKMLSKICLDEVVKQTDRRKRNIVNGNSTYIIGHAQVPVALIEVGYMTNYDDLNYLLNNQNQKFIANGIYNGIKKAINVTN